MKKILSIAFLSLLFFNCTNDDEKEKDGSYSVSGYLHNGENPVPDASVDLDGSVQYTAKTNSEGFFEIKNVSSGTHKLTSKIELASGSFSTSTDTVEVNNDVVLENLMLPDPVIFYDAEVERELELNEVSLSWSAYTGDDFREYKLYQHSTSGLDETTGELLHVATTAQDTTFTVELPHNSDTFFRVFVRDDFGLLGGSNIINVSIEAYENDPEITVNVQKDFFLGSEEEHELYFETPMAGLYSVAWFDSWFDGYSAGSIVVSAYNDDKTTYYFQNERLIQMNGSPFPMYVPNGERVHLSVKHNDTRFPGTYGVHITPLGEDISTLLTMGSTSTIAVDLGDVKMVHFEAQAEKDYEITVGNIFDGGAFDDGIETHISIYEENSDSFSVYKENIPFPCCGGTTSFTVSADTAKKIYLIIDGAYWFRQNTVTISVNEL